MSNNPPPAWLTDPHYQDWIAQRAHEQWERDLCDAFIHLVYGVGTPPAQPVDFSEHPIFAVLHARWLASRTPPLPVEEDQP